MEFPETITTMRENPMKLMVNILKYLNKKGNKFWPIWITMFIKCGISLSQIIFAVKTWNNPKLLISVLCTFPISLSAIAKLVTIYVQRHKIDYLYRTIENEFWDINLVDPKTRNRISARFSFTNKLAANQVIFGVTFVSFFLFYPVFQDPARKKHLASLVWVPADTDKSPLHEFMQLTITFSLLLNTFSNLYHDFLLIYASQHLAAQFIILRQFILNINDKLMDDLTDDEKYCSKEYQDTIEFRLKICLEHHNLLLTYGDVVKTFFSNTLFVVVLVCSSIASLTAIAVLNMDPGDMWKPFILSLLTSVVSIEFIIMAAQSTDLNDQSFAIIDAYSTEWYLFQPKTRRMLCFLLKNAQDRDMTMTAAGLAIVDNRLIVSVYQKVFSIITLLRTISM